MTNEVDQKQLYDTINEFRKEVRDMFTDLKDGYGKRICTLEEATADLAKQVSFMQGKQAVMGAIAGIVGGSLAGAIISLVLVGLRGGD